MWTFVEIVSRIGLTILAVFTVKQIYKAYRVRLNNKKRQRKRLTKDFTIRKIRERCKYVQVCLYCNFCEVFSANQININDCEIRYFCT